MVQVEFIWSCKDADSVASKANAVGFFLWKNFVSMSFMLPNKQKKDRNIQKFFTATVTSHDASNLCCLFWTAYIDGFERKYPVNAIMLDFLLLEVLLDPSIDVGSAK